MEPGSHILHRPHKHARSPNSPHPAPTKQQNRHRHTQAASQGHTPTLRVALPLRRTVRLGPEQRLPCGRVARLLLLPPLRLLQLLLIPAPLFQQPAARKWDSHNYRHRLIACEFDCRCPPVGLAGQWRGVGKANSDAGPCEYKSEPTVASVSWNGKHPSPCGHVSTRTSSGHLPLSPTLQQLPQHHAACVDLQGQGRAGHVTYLRIHSSGSS